MNVKTSCVTTKSSEKGSSIPNRPSSYFLIMYGSSRCFSFRLYCLRQSLPAVLIVLHAPFKKLKLEQPKAELSFNISGDKEASTLNIFRDNEVLIPSGSIAAENVRRGRPFCFRHRSHFRGGAFN